MSRKSFRPRAVSSFLSVGYSATKLVGFSSSLTDLSTEGSGQGDFIRVKWATRVVDSGRERWELAMRNFPAGRSFFDCMRYSSSQAGLARRPMRRQDGAVACETISPRRRELDSGEQ